MILKNLVRPKFESPHFKIFDFEEGGVSNYILGLDPSLSSTGLSFLNPYTLENHIGVLDPKFAKGVKVLGLERCLYYSYSIKALLELYRPSVVVLENYSFGSTTSAYDLGELGGFYRILIKEYLESRMENNQRVYPDLTDGFLKVSPTDLKKFITGKGNSKKNVMLMELYKNFGITVTDDNIGDAVSLALYGLKKKYPSAYKKLDKLNIS